MMSCRIHYNLYITVFTLSGYGKWSNIFYFDLNKCIYVSQFVSILVIILLVHHIYFMFNWFENNVVTL